MFRRILVPVDFTPKSPRAVRAASRVAERSGGVTTLLHVIERVDAGDPGAFAAFYRKLEQNARRKLSEFAGLLSKKGLPVRSAVVYGNRVNEILRYASSCRADLIVMSSHRLPVKPRSQDWGTISYKVSVLSRCPVLLVK